MIRLFLLQGALCDLTKMIGRVPLAKLPDTKCDLKSPKTRQHSLDLPHWMANQGTTPHGPRVAGESWGDYGDYGDYGAERPGEPPAPCAAAAAAAVRYGFVVGSSPASRSARSGAVSSVSVASESSLDLLSTSSLRRGEV